MIVLDLPFPPSSNNLFSNRGNGGGRFLSKKYSAWRESAGLEIQAMKPGKISGKVVLSIALGRKDNRKRDCSNFVKAIEDLCVTHGVIDDDSNVEAVAVRWCERTSGARVTIIPALSTVLERFARLAA